MIESLTKNIVVLGANSDIGSVLVRRAAADPACKILAVWHKAKRERKRMANVQELPKIDLTRQASLERLADTVTERFQGPFSVVHSVGHFWRHKPLVETAFDEISEMLDSQILTLIGAARFLSPVMKEKGGGRFVAFSCNSVLYNYPDMAPFTASKAAIETFTRCFANEHSQFGISAMALALATIETLTVKQAKPSGDHENFMTPEFIADCILNNVLSLPHEATGNVIKLFKYSPSFYHQSYYDRNPREQLLPR